MEVQQAIDIVRKINKIAGEKPLQNSSLFGNKKDTYNISDLPEYFPTYRMAAQLRQDARIHIEKGLFPDKLFIKKAPNMTEEEFEYIKANYKQVTTDISMDYINTMSRAWSDDNWFYRAANDEERVMDETFSEYIQRKIKYFGSLENWGKLFLPTIKAIDANGVIAAKPYYRTKEVDGQFVIDSDFMVDVQPEYYNCLQVVSAPGLPYFVFDVTDYDNANRKYRYEVWDKENIWYLEKKDDGAIEANFNVFEYYRFTDLKHTPCHYIGGIPMIYKGVIYWQSPFAMITDLLDLITINSQTLQIVINHCGFPTRVMEMPDCNQPSTEYHTQCVDGYVKYFEGDITRKCPRCEGTGLNLRVSPTGVVAIRSKTKLDDGTNSKPADVLAYISPDTAILDFLMKKIQADEVKARGVLHIYNSNTKVQGTDQITATGENMDNKAMMSAVKTVSDQMFTLTEAIGNDIGYIRYVEKFRPPYWDYPKSFDFKTENQYIAEIDAVTKADLGATARQLIILRYLKSTFFSDATVAKFLKVIEYADSLMGMTSTEITIQQNKGKIEDWKVTLHNQAIALLQNLQLNNEKFLEGDDFKGQVAALITAAQEATPKVESATETTVNGILQRVSA